MTLLYLFCETFFFRPVDGTPKVLQMLFRNKNTFFLLKIRPLSKKKKLGPSLLIGYSIIKSILLICKKNNHRCVYFTL